MMKNALIAPSLLSADFFNLAKDLEIIHKSGADLLHLDVMDGQFVSNLTFGTKFIADLRPHTEFDLDVHLMIQTPSRMLKEFIEAGSDILTFHWEAEIHHHRWIDYIKNKGIKAGLSIVPSTPIFLLEPLLPFLDNILVMTVNPGFGGQAFLPFCIQKISWLNQMRLDHGFSYTITVDGGINLKTGIQCRTAGADILVTGSSFFSEPNKLQFVQLLKGETLEKH